HIPDLHPCPTRRSSDLPWDRDWPEECSLGTSPTKDPMVAPVKRCQSPISTAKASPVRLLIPRKHPSRRASGVNWNQQPDRARFGDRKSTRLNSSHVPIS